MAFAGIGGSIDANATAETLLIRGLGSLAFFMLNAILAIGPLARIDRRFLPLLYNRRHFGVAMFVVALAHSAFGIIQFHALGDVNPLVALFTSNMRWNSFRQFPFELLGFTALAILFLMAATSHDFWLHTLTPAVWKRLHMLVYVAYLLLVAHIALGLLQSESSPVLATVLLAPVAIVTGLHLFAGARESRFDRVTREGFVEIADPDSIPEGRARVICAAGERIAVSRNCGKLQAISNVCRHQNGPLGEGRIVNGCVTCPWHGYQYDPVTGTSPPPYADRVPTFPIQVIGGRVFVSSKAGEPQCETISR